MSARDFCRRLRRLDGEEIRNIYREMPPGLTAQLALKLWAGVDWLLGQK